MHIDVTWGRVDDSSLLRRAVARFCEVAPEQVAEYRVCADCGSSEHGQPRVRVANRSVHVSLSRSEPYAVVAVSDAGPIGIDVDRAETPAWVRREAQGKAQGVGITGELAEPEPVVDAVAAPTGFCAVVAFDGASMPPIVVIEAPATPAR